MRKRILAIIAVFAMGVAMLPTIVMANSNSNTITLDVSKGVIDLYPEGYAQTGSETVYIDDEYGGYEEVTDVFWTPGDANRNYKALGGDKPTEWKSANCKTTTYIITGKSDDDLDSYLDITNFTNEEVVYNLIFKDLEVRSGEWSTAIRFKGNAPIVLNITNIGNNKVYAGNHAAFKVNNYDDHRGCSDEEGCISDQWWSECIQGEVISDYAYYDKGVDNLDPDESIIITVNIMNTFGSTLDLGTLWTDEYIDENYDSDHYTYGYNGPKIYHSESPFVNMKFKINGKEVVDDGDGGEDDALSNFDNFDNTDLKCTHKTILDKWNKSPLDVDKMTVEEFENNINGIECNLVCDDCGDSVILSPEKTRVNNDGTGQYGVVYELTEGTMTALRNSSAANEDNGVWWSEPYNLVAAGDTGNTNSPDGTTNNDETPDSGDHTNLMLWICLMAAGGVGAAFVIGRRRVER